jgi:hypothetical protein
VRVARDGQAAHQHLVEQHVVAGLFAPGLGLRLVGADQLDLVVALAQALDHAGQGTGHPIDFGRVGFGDDRHPQRAPQGREFVHHDGVFSRGVHALMWGHDGNRCVTALGWGGASPDFHIRWSPSGHARLRAVTRTHPPAQRACSHVKGSKVKDFLSALKTQRWDDHRYYHHSRINQTLHLISALSFPGGLRLLFSDPALAPAGLGRVDGVAPVGPFLLRAARL